VHALSHCTHPEEGTTVTAVIEPDGSRMTILWCGVCGAIHVPGEVADEWIRPGLGLAMEADNRLTALAGSLRAFMAQVGELTATAHEVSVRSGEGFERGRSELRASVVSLDNAGAELARHAHALLGEIGE
jgi:hypothetical protein